MILFNREQFEEMAAPIFKRIEDTLQSVLGNASELQFIMCISFSLVKSFCSNDSS